MERLEQKLREEYKEEIAELKRAQLCRNLDLARQIRAEMTQNSRRIARLEAEKKELESYTPKQLSTVKSKGWLTAHFNCIACGSETARLGRWKCKGCHHEQRNVW